MNHTISSTLSLFFREHPELLATPQKIYFPRASYSPLFNELSSHEIVCMQTYAPHAEALRQHRITLREHPSLSHESSPTSPCFTLAIVCPTHHKKESLFLLAHAASLLVPGGTLLIAAENHRGGKSYRKELVHFGESPQSWSKNHSVISWATLPQDVSPSAQATAYLALGGFKMLAETSYFSHVGVYGWDKIDGGSALLIASAPLPSQGRGADLGCGYGYLSAQILSRQQHITEITLIDTELLAIASAQRTLSSLSASATIHYHWGEMHHYTPSTPFDWVVMNPPCHTDDTLDYDLGISCVRAAQRLLKKGGTLTMVALEHIPYEATLRSSFTHVKEVARQNGFKVIHAIA